MPFKCAHLCVKTAGLHVKLTSLFHKETFISSVVREDVTGPYFANPENFITVNNVAIFPFGYFKESPELSVIQPM